MQDNHLKAINWIISGMEYNSGVDLLVKITHKQTYYDLFNGKGKSLPDKLAYEICKATMLADHITWKDFIRKVLAGNFESENQLTDSSDVKLSERMPGIENKQKICKPDSSETIETTETIETKPLSQYPSVIRRIIHEYAALFQERSKLHSVMSEMPESNAESV
jgi:hypothetical protein